MLLLDAAVGWLLFGGVALAVGSLSNRFLVLPRAVTPSAAEAREAEAFLAQLARWASVLALFGLALALVRQVVEFRDPFAPLAEDLRVLLASGWGATWLRSVQAGVVALVGFWLTARGLGWGWWVAAAGVLVVAAYPALTGHAAGEEGALGTLALGADILHVLAAGAWIGGLAAILLLEGRSLRASPRDGSSSLLPSLVPAFSPVAVVSVGTLMATGVFGSWLHLDGLSALWTTPYGRLLSLKLLVVAATLALGAINWRRLTPRLHQEDGQAAMRRSALVELTFANIVLLLTAVLVRTSPMGH